MLKLGAGNYLSCSLDVPTNLSKLCTANIFEHNRFQLNYIISMVCQINYVTINILCFHYGFRPDVFCENIHHEDMNSGDVILNIRRDGITGTLLLLEIQKKSFP